MTSPLYLSLPLLSAIAYALREQARADLENAKRDIEALILGKDSAG